MQSNIAIQARTHSIAPMCTALLFQASVHQISQKPNDPVAISTCADFVMETTTRVRACRKKSSSTATLRRQGLHIDLNNTKGGTKGNRASDLIEAFLQMINLDSILNSQIDAKFEN